MFYKKEEKELLGRYFKYYRNEHHIMFKSITSLGFCEYRTYKKIEDGIISKNDELYDSLMKFFAINLNTINKLREINPYIYELYDACEWYDEEKIEDIINKITVIMYSMSKSNIICELLESLTIIRNFYIDYQCISEHDLFKMLKYIELWNNELSSLLLEVCGKSNLRFILKNEMFDLMNRYLKKDDNISRYWYARICKYNVNYSEAEDNYQYLHNYYESSNNHLRKARIIMDLHSLYRDVDYKKAEKYTILMNQLKEYDLPKDMQEALYYNLGMYYYLKDDYEKALPNYEKSNEICNDPLTILFICACQSRLNCLKYYSVNENHQLYPYIKYFQLKSNKQDCLYLEKYIEEKTMDLLMQERYEQPFWKMFSFEMSYLVKQTRNYKKYLEFQEKMQFATKRAA